MTEVTLTDGSPVPADGSHLERDGATNQQRGYVVLSEAERAKGFVRPVRDTYIHVGVGGHEIDPDDPSRHGRRGRGCGAATKMGTALAETYARDPYFYSGTFCVGCRDHFPVGEDGEFVWEDGTRVGT